eukprot:7386001-Prymnesium_polylepis.2
MLTATTTAPVLQLPATAPVLQLPATAPCYSPLPAAHQVDVEPDDRQRRRAESLEHEERLARDQPVAPRVGALREDLARLEVGERALRHERRLAADADKLARRHEPLRLLGVRGGVERDGKEGRVVREVGRALLEARHLDRGRELEEALVVHFERPVRRPVRHPDAGGLLKRALARRRLLARDAVRGRLVDRAHLHLAPELLRQRQQRRGIFLWRRPLRPLLLLLRRRHALRTSGRIDRVGLVRWWIVATAPARLQHPPKRLVACAVGAALHVPSPRGVECRGSVTPPCLLRPVGARVVQRHQRALSRRVRAVCAAPAVGRGLALGGDDLRHLSFGVWGTSARLCSAQCETSSGGVGHVASDTLLTCKSTVPKLPKNPSDENRRIENHTPSCKFSRFSDSVVWSNPNPRRRSVLSLAHASKLAQRGDLPPPRIPIGSVSEGVHREGGRALLQEAQDALAG